MIINYWKTAWRNLRRNRTFTVINVGGLAVGMAACVLILVWLQQQISFDRFHANTDRLYKVWNRSASKSGEVNVWDITASPVGTTLQQQVPEIKQVARTYWPEEHLLTAAEKGINTTGLCVDPAFLTMFSFPLLQGSTAHALDGTNSIVLTRSLAQKIFGRTDVLNQLVQLDQKHTFKVTGVLQDLPSNTQFSFQYLLPWLFLQQNGMDSPSWTNFSYHTYVELQPGASEAAVDAKIKTLAIKQDKDGPELFLHPAAKWHLYSRFDNGKITGGQIETVRLMAIIAGLILLIACINFMNLSTAKSDKRAKEVGVRKVSGATKGALVMQFIVESILIAAVAAILAFVLVQLALPAFGTLVGSRLHMPYNNLLFWGCAALFVLVTGLLAGSYPAFFLSSFKPVKVLKGSFKAAHALVTPRKILVVLQFGLAVVFMISTVVIYEQIKYAQQRNSGYSRDHLVEHAISGDLGKNFDLLKHDLLSQGIASAVTRSSFSITTPASSTGAISWEGKSPDADVNFDLMGTTGDFIKTYQLQLLEGRDIDLANNKADSNACLVNEAAVQAMKMKNPVGKTLKRNGTDWQIVGVFKNFILASPFNPVNPMMVRATAGWSYNIAFRLNTKPGIPENLHRAEAVFKKYNPAYPFDYKFVEEKYAQKFDDQETTGSLAKLFAGLTIFISCLGLFGLAVYMAEERVKEVGVRKILGASVSSITLLLSKDFLKLVCISFVVGAPVAWWLVYRWLQDFNYRITLHWWMFAVAGAGMLLLAFVTVSVQVVKSATANPVKSLRTS